MNVTIDVENITTDQAKTVGWVMIKKVIFFSGTIIQWVVEKCNEWGIGLKSYQVSVLFFLIDAIILFLVLKFVAKPLLKIIIALLLIWFMAGFFFPVG